MAEKRISEVQDEIKKIIYDKCDSASNLDIRMYLGMRKTGYVCPEDYILYEDSIDFSIVERDGSIEGDQEDNDDNSIAWKRSIIGLITWERDLTIKPTMNSRFLQKFQKVLFEDDMNKDGGFHVQKYMQDGFCIYIEVYSNNSLIYSETAKYVQCTNWADLNWSDQKDSESELELAFFLTETPTYKIESLPNTYGVPSANTAPEITAEITADLSSTSITASNIVLEDPDLLSSGNNIIYMTVYGADGEKIGETSGSETTLSITDENMTETSVYSGKLEFDWDGSGDIKSVGYEFSNVTPTEESPETV